MAGEKRMAEHRTRKSSQKQNATGKLIKYGDRMRETYIRSKHTVKNLSKDGHEDETDYAVDNTSEASREISRDVVRTVGTTAKRAVEHAKKAAKKSGEGSAKEGSAEELGAEDDNPIETSDADDMLPEVSEEATLEVAKDSTPKHLNDLKNTTIRENEESVAQNERKIAGRPVEEKRADKGTVRRTKSSDEQRKGKTKREPDKSKNHVSRQVIETERGEKQEPPGGEPGIAYAQRSTVRTEMPSKEIEDPRVDSERKRVSASPHKYNVSAAATSSMDRPSQFNTKPTDQRNAGSGTPATENRKTGQAAETTSIHSSSSAKQSSYHLTYSGRREPRNGNSRPSIRTEQEGLKQSNRAGRNQRNPLQRNVQENRARKTFVAARQKTIASAQAKRTTQKRIVAVIDNTKKAVASIGAVVGGAGSVVVILLVTVFLVGTVASSGFGIFLSPEATKQSPQKLPAVVRELDEEFHESIEKIKESVPHDVVEIYGAKASWPEVLSVYAVKTTTDPENGMEVATMDEKKKKLLSDTFWTMNSISYSTKTEYCNVIREREDGEGNVTEQEETYSTTTLVIVVSHMKTDEAADAYHFDKDQREELQELLEMDNAMWFAVLTGLSDDITGENSEFIQTALSQIGNYGGEPYWSWYGYSSHADWCACFVSWCADQCGYTDAGLVPQFSGCQSGAQWFKNRNRWIDGAMEPAPGMIVFYDWDDEDSDGQDGSADHVGIVEYVENGIVHTIEGNWGDSVAQREFPIGYYDVLGYGCVSKHGLQSYN